MGIHHKLAMAFAKLLIDFTVATCVCASQIDYANLEAEIPAPPGESYSQNEVSMLQESAGAAMKADIVYRVSWNTVYDANHDSTASKGTFKIQIYGKDGTDTGQQELVTHPGYECAAAKDPDCYPDITGKVQASAATVCACDPSNAGYNEEDAKWQPHSGITQSKYIKAPEVDEITKVVLTGDNEANDKWHPGFLKINMNDFKDGLGNGIYYMDLGGKKVDKNDPITMKSDATDASGEGLKMENLASHKYGIIKCEAASCEEKMDKMMKTAEK